MGAKDAAMAVAFTAGCITAVLGAVLTVAGVIDAIRWAMVGTTEYHAPEVMVFIGFSTLVVGALTAAETLYE